MGNHEYCTECGASDFHNGVSCEQAYPEKWAEKEKERKAKQAVADRESVRVSKLVRATLKGGKKAVTARLILLDKESNLLDEEAEALEAKRGRLYNEAAALRKHCAHPGKYIDGGFMYTSCRLCGEMW
jgi:hypothetical protein